MLRILVSTLVLVVASSAFANREGYIKNGKEYITFQDGKKMAAWPPAEDKLADNKAKDDRQPGSDAQPYSGGATLYFFEDTGKKIRCFTMTKSPGYGVSEQISCATYL